MCASKKKKKICRIISSRNTILLAVMTYFYLAMIESLATCFLMQNSLKKPDEFDNKITRD